MTESKLTVRVGLGFIGSQILICSAIIWAWVGGGMTPSEALTAATVILPLLTGYTMLIAGYFWKNRLSPPSPSEPQLSVAWVTTVLIFVGVFVVALLASVIAMAMNMAFKSFDEFKVALLLIEVLFAGSVGFAMKSLFKGPQDGN